MSTVLDYIRPLGKRDSYSTKWLLLLVSAFVMALMFPSSISVENEYSRGSVWTESDLYAPFSFPLYKEEQEYERERSEAVAHVYRVFENETDVPAASSDSVRKFFFQLRMIIDDKKADTAAIRFSLRLFPVTFTDAEWKSLWHLRTRELKGGGRMTLATLERDVLAVMNGMYEQGIIDVRSSEMEGDTVGAVRKKTAERILPLKTFIDRDALGKRTVETLTALYRGDNDTVAIAAKIVLSFITPNIQFRKAQTDREVRFALESVPRTYGAVKEGDRIIRKNERITDDVKRILDSLRKSKIERGADINRAATFAGKFLHAFVIMWLFSMYVYMFRKSIFHNNAKLGLIGFIVLSSAIVAYATTLYEGELPVKFLIAVPVTSMLLAIIFDSRVAFYGTVVTSLLVAGVRGNDYSIALCSIAAGALAVYTVRDIKKRTQLFRSITFIFVGYAVSICALALERSDAAGAALSQVLMAGVNAVVSPVLTYGLLIFFEKILHVSTDLALLDLSNFNHPLLKELSLKTPGTFHHSVSMSTLAEAAADAVGANPVLTRVGALYHDIGKIVNPTMFVENQKGEENMHEAINPKKSARIIASHVADGMRLGREYGIPEEVLQFIPMHHGKTKIGFFYEQALEQSLAPESVNEKDYRYLGPRPNTKEAAIVMLADAVEASTRSIEEPSSEKIKENISAIFKMRFMEGELDESNLTLSDLTKIQERFLTILLGVYHPRIKYPEKEGAEDVHVVETPADVKFKVKKTDDDKRRRKIHKPDTP
jgi:cyclic-di-AMP phosphodiesterase PgpH